MIRVTVIYIIDFVSNRIVIANRLAVCARTVCADILDGGYIDVVGRLYLLRGSTSIHKVPYKPRRVRDRSNRRLGDARGDCHRAAATRRNVFELPCDDVVLHICAYRVTSCMAHIRQPGRQGIGNGKIGCCVFVVDIVNVIGNFIPDDYRRAVDTCRAELTHRLFRGYPTDINPSVILQGKGGVVRGGAGGNRIAIHTAGDAGGGADVHGGKSGARPGADDMLIAPVLKARLVKAAVALIDGNRTADHVNRLCRVAC